MLHSTTLLPLASSLLSFVFVGVVLEQWRRHRKIYQLVWALGLLWYALSTGTEFLGGAFGWNLTLYRAWYLTGAIGVACYLGLGTVYLHATDRFGGLVLGALVLGALPALFGGYLILGLGSLGVAAVLGLVRWRRPALFAHAFFAAVLVGSLLAAVLIFTAPVDASLLPRGPDQVVTGQAFPASVRVITPLFNITGAFALIFGAVYSALSFGRTRTKPRRMISNLLIAVGAFVPSLTSGLTRFGLTDVFFIGELVGVTVIFAGFLIGIGALGSLRYPIFGGITPERRRA